MHSAGVPEDANGPPAKRMRRPSVRLHQPYYENPGHRKLQRQWKAIKKESASAEGGPKKPRTAKPPQGKRKKEEEGGSESSKGLLNYEEELAIGNWKSFDAASRERDFKRKRVRPSSTKKWSSAKTLEEEIEKPPLSSGGDSKPNGEDNLEANGIHSHLLVQGSEPSSPNCSFLNEEENRDDDKLSEDDNAVGLQPLRNSRDSNEVRGDDDYGRIRDEEGSDEDGVRIWLNQLGLAKYVPLFKVHEVDDKVLPFLTLDDLKDMGINAVGSRRKMYASIQKLGKGLL